MGNFPDNQKDSGKCWSHTEKDFGRTPKLLAVSSSSDVGSLRLGTVCRDWGHPERTREDGRESPWDRDGSRETHSDHTLTLSRCSTDPVTDPDRPTGGQTDVGKVDKV